MVSNVSNVYSYNGEQYERKSHLSSEIGAMVALGASGLIYKALPSFSNPFLNQMKKEHLNNHHYKDVFIRAVKNSSLEAKGLKLANVTDLATDIGRGLNACYMPKERVIALNKNLASISGFHELGHAMNHLKSKTGWLLQKLRRPGYAIAALMGYVALNDRPKPKGADRNFKEFVEDNCGKIAFVSLLPTVIEESMASYKGVKMAKEAGLAESLVSNLKRFYRKALWSYLGYAIVTGVSVFATSKIMEKFTRPRKIEREL